VGGGVLAASDALGMQGRRLGGRGRGAALPPARLRMTQQACLTASTAPMVVDSPATVDSASG
jgi:hypothetical protein